MRLVTTSKDYGRDADAVVHEAFDRIIETMERLDELGAKVGGTNVNSPMDRR